MQKTIILSLALLGGFMVASLVTSQSELQARPKYLGVFVEKYPGVAEEAKKVKCGVCHPENDKKVRNGYGNAVGTGLPEKNAKEDEVIIKALETGAAVKPEGGDQTYGEQIEAGKLPN